MNMRVRALRDFISPVFGNVVAGQTLPSIRDSHAKQWADIQLVEILGPEEQESPPATSSKTVEAGITPPEVGGSLPPAVPAASTSASQAGQVSPKQTVKSSANGAKPRQRAKTTKATKSKSSSK